MEKEIFLVLGEHWGDDDSYSLVGESCLFERYEDAKHELLEILKEIEKQADENGYDFEVQKEEDILHITFETGSEERYRIYKRKIR